jgi:hypothetical protein
MFVITVECNNHCSPLLSTSLSWSLISNIVEGNMDNHSNQNGYSGLFYIMLILGIIGVVGFIIVASSAAASGM